MTFSYNIPTETVSCEISVAEAEQLTADSIANLKNTFMQLVAELKTQITTGAKT